MKRVDYSNTKITGGFWAEKQKLVREVTVKAVYDRFFETGRFNAFKCDESSPVKPHIFWDSDVAKWIEGVAYLTKEKREYGLEEIVDGVVDEIVKNQEENGYFNSYFLVRDKDMKFKNRDWHELYCLGHLIEAAVAYYEATGKDKLLKAVCKFTDYAEKLFKTEKTAPYRTPGHEEIELALVRLYECTGEKRYLELSKHFVDVRGLDPEVIGDWTHPENSQSHKPVREQTSAEGHAVRAVYLYCAMADLALKYNDEGLKNACEKLFDNIANKRMYITGGIGSSHHGEAFTVDYDLPNMLAYSESCAALGLALFANRMLLLDNDSKYSDTVERALYNGFLSSISLSGNEFFYTNPLELMPYMLKRDTSVKAQNPSGFPITRRQRVFDCSCCPPNIVRFIPSVANLMYTHSDNTIFVHQFINGKTEIEIEGKKYTVEQETSYPYGSQVKIKVSGGNIKVGVRVPYYNQGYTGKTEKGYAFFDICGEGEISLDFKFEPRFVYANANVLHDANKCAIINGPLVYCMEGCDNSAHLRNIVFNKDAKITKSFSEELNVPTLKVEAEQLVSDESLYSFDTRKEKIQATLIPYFAFANREECEMTVWLNRGN